MLLPQGPESQNAHREAAGNFHLADPGRDRRGTLQTREGADRLLRKGGDPSIQFRHGDDEFAQQDDADLK